MPIDLAAVNNSQQIMEHFFKNFNSRLDEMPPYVLDHEIEKIEDPNFVSDEEGDAQTIKPEVPVVNADTIDARILNWAAFFGRYIIV